MITFGQLETAYADLNSPYWGFTDNMQEIDDAIHSFMILRFIRPIPLATLMDKLECKKLSTGIWIIVSSAFPRIPLPTILVNNPKPDTYTYKNLETSELDKIVTAVGNDLYPTFINECNNLIGRNAL